ncbi:NrfD/PsrC family molybdoenzyme membrane anchor subunit [Ornithinicoccus halotolerans]|uniref:NrfD/PsrC family molybdoenzyme membrane anchor subunit n=1 Tax=Ornithinicoccus halotolerans TaxID=1748220 RepID=UPI001E43E104|nr:NrfD/PsrC family molybdoenzyme membrane anchor subunit [Ornithinicoccus halotolerans]
MTAEARPGVSMVPGAEFRSYYDRAVLKASPWEIDIPIYLFSGGLAAGSSLLAAGADLSSRPGLRRAGRLTALGGLGVSLVALVHDLGRPGRFLKMLRVAKFTSPMSVGTWLLATYGPLAGVAAAGEVARLVGGPKSLGLPGQLLAAVERPAGVAAAVTAPTIASYTGVLLADTATPTWHGAYRELPFLFTASAAAASGGMGMLAAPVSEAGPARRMALAGALTELVAERRMEQSLGMLAEPLHQGRAGRWMRASSWLTAAGAVGTLLAGRSRVAAGLSGLALLAGSWCTRYGVFEAGQASARDPRYTVVPQRERIEAGEATPSVTAGSPAP